MATGIHQSRVHTSTKALELPRKNAAPLLVATDASPSADAAIRAARVIALHTGREVRLLAVHEPLPSVAPEVQIAESFDMEAERRAGLRSQVREQLQRIGIDEEWPLEVVSGDPGATIANVAARTGAALVIMGLGEHGLFERILGDETVLGVLRLGTVPVLAVAPGFTELPKNALAATDFSPSSVRAVSIASELMSSRGTLTLAHVLSPDPDASNGSMTNAGLQGTIGRAFDRVIADIGLGKAERIQRTVLVGDPAKALLKFSATTNPDLIVTGSHGHDFLSRLLIGSVSQRLVRGARCSVLVAPPQEGPSFIDEMPSATSRFASYEWAERLEEFTRRNVARTATMEVIDPDLGAQIEEKGFPFVGASFDPRDGQVHIMLGSLGLSGRHLTRSIKGASAIQVLRNRAGQDLMLRVAHGRGQTLLTLER